MFQSEPHVQFSSVHFDVGEDHAIRRTTEVHLFQTGALIEIKQLLDGRGLDRNPDAGIPERYLNDSTLTEGSADGHHRIGHILDFESADAQATAIVHDRLPPVAGFVDVVEVHVLPDLAQ
ncbi:hypothetical protein D9M70_297080 [compost metagenome]